MNSLESLYPEVYDCNALQKQITILETDIDYFRKRFNSGEANAREKILKQRQETFYVLSCDKTIDFQLQSATKAIFDKNAELAKKRIELDSIKSRNTLIGFGIVILLSGLLIIVKHKK